MLPIIPLLIGSCKSYEPIPRVEIGEIDLTGWDYETDGVVNLRGEWEFYWDTLAEPKEIQELENKKRYIHVPGSWHRKEIGVLSLPRLGYCTYRTIVRHGMKGTYMGIRVPYTGTAYTMYVDGEKLAQNGTVGKTREEMQPQYMNQNVYYRPEGSSSEIVIQVSNFYHRRSGLWQDIQFGLKPDIETESTSRMMYEILLIGSLIFMGVPLIAMYIMTRYNRAPLYFGLLCILIALRTLFIGEVMITQLFPNISWEFAIKFEYIFTYGSVAIISLFIYSLFRDIYSRKMLIVVHSLTGLIISSVIFTKAIRFTQVNIVFQVIMEASLIYALYVIIRALRFKLPSAKTILFGFIIILAVVFNNMLFFNGIIHSSSLSPISFTDHIARNYTLFSFWTVPMNIISFVFYLLVLNLFSIKLGIDYFREFKSSLIEPTKNDKEEQEQDREKFYIDHEISVREREIIQLIRKGLSNKEIAERINITPGTVKVHVHNIYQKTGVKNRTALTHLAASYGSEEYPDATLV
ncbi:MAG: LuxR C-terminal-related transcriptional regulator [Spirochaetia bacterium]